ncbi:MAG: chemotaxis protein CheA [Chloroflexia bacterium]
MEFRPSPALAEQGINVNTVRARLREAGEIVHAAPRVDAEGSISFEFLVVGPVDEEQVALWESRGLSCRPYPLPAATPAVEAQAPRAPTAPLPPAPSLTPSNVVRVDLARLDELMRLVGELVIDRSRLEDELRQMERALPSAEWRSLQEISSVMGRHLRDLREAVMRVRMVPIGEVFDRMRFVVRDLARDSGKQVRLEMSGQATEIDKYIVERMMDPLLHLVRNAVSHGLEMPKERAERGKPPEGTIRLSASTVGDLVAIEVEDDGRGIHLEEVAARARAEGLLVEGASLGPHNLLDILCAPGFSTRVDADVASGRGVGMAVVRRTVRELGGTLSLETWPGRGTRFLIHLPLTLAIIDALLVHVARQTYAVPQPAVREIIEMRPEQIRHVGGDEIASYRGSALPLLRLAPFFRLGEPVSPVSYALVVGSGPGTIGLVVDRVLGKREIVVHALSDALVRVPGIAGATDLGDGRAVLILDVGALVRWRQRG